jgi:hypothetical protein
MPTEKITLNVTQFVPGGCCAISRPVIQGGGGNRVRFKNETDAHDHTLVAHGKGNAPLDLAFTIPGYTPGPGPSPMTFSGANAEANFVRQSVSGSTVTVTNVFTHRGKGPDNPRWSYAISIVNSAGQQGLIDPGIENQEQT